MKAAIKEMADKALRTIVLGYKSIRGNEDMTTIDKVKLYEIEKTDFTLVAILGIADILRPEVTHAIA
jgi:Ca2+ transporting ATPase